MYDVVIVGGGISGLTVAHRLKHKNIRVLERESRCGGRVFSVKMGDYVYNTGAQVVIGEQSPPALLARELGVPMTLINKSKMPMHINGKTVAASSDIAFLWQLPIPLLQKIKLGWNVARLRRRFGQFAGILPELDDPRLAELDALTLSDLVGAKQSDYKGIWDALSLGTTTQASDQVAAFQPLSSFLAFLNSEYYVENGTSALTDALWKSVEDKVVTQASVTEVRRVDGIFEVCYEHGGETKTLQAARCVMTIPGTLVANLIVSLPEWKTQALAQLDYGQYTSAGFLLDQPASTFLPEGVWRMPVVGKHFCSITDPTFTFDSSFQQHSGQGLFRVYCGHDASLELRNLGEEGALDLLQKELDEVLPGSSARVSDRAITHWTHAVPPWRVGRLRVMADLLAPTDGIHYCGDYTDSNSMSGAVNSANRVLKELERN